MPQSITREGLQGSYVALRGALVTVLGEEDSQPLLSALAWLMQEADHGEALQEPTAAHTYHSKHCLY